MVIVVGSSSRPGVVRLAWYLLAVDPYTHRLDRTLHAVGSASEQGNCVRPTLPSTNRGYGTNATTHLHLGDRTCEEMIRWHTSRYENHWGITSTGSLVLAEDFIQKSKEEKTARVMINARCFELLRIIVRGRAVLDEPQGNRALGGAINIGQVVARALSLDNSKTTN
ncbi:hypothetical protein M0804_003082 [Polistes exclamans]|nr:hypothetical protein M0804_003082 [Polistes exclamans]